jgi:protein-tyrosine phosphatase
MRLPIALARETKHTLQVYGFGVFTASTGATALAPLFVPSFLYFAATAALAGGAAGLLGYFASEHRCRQPTLVFVSTAGQCRDPMAKAIMDQLFAEREQKVRVYATALRDNPGQQASKAARHVTHEELGKDLLAGHQSLVLNEALISEADLILTMDEAHAREIRKNFPNHRSRVHSLLRFLGEAGDIEDPWRAPDEMDTETIERYRACFQSLRDALTRGADSIYERVIA